MRRRLGRGPLALGNGGAGRHVAEELQRSRAAVAAPLTDHAVAVAGTVDGSGRSAARRGATGVLRREPNKVGLRQRLGDGAMPLGLVLGRARPIKHHGVVFERDGHLFRALPACRAGRAGFAHGTRSASATAFGSAHGGDASVARAAPRRASGDGTPGTGVRAAVAAARRAGLWRRIVEPTPNCEEKTGQRHPHGPHSWAIAPIVATSRPFRWGNLALAGAP